MAAEDAELRDALGHVAVAFDDLEFSVSRFIWALLDEDATAGAIITSDRSFRELIRLASLLYVRKVGLALQSFDEIEKRLKQAAEDRDVYSHSWWNTKPQPSCGWYVGGHLGRRRPISCGSPGARGAPTSGSCPLRSSTRQRHAWKKSGTNSKRCSRSRERRRIQISGRKGTRRPRSTNILTVAPVHDVPPTLRMRDPEESRAAGSRRPLRSLAAV